MIAPSVLVGKVLLSSRMLFGSDVLGGFYFSRGFVGLEMLEGRLPQWDPHSMCGFPILAGMQSAILYPLSWAVVLLSPAAFWTFTAWIHLVLSGLFAFGWASQGLRLSRWGSFTTALMFMLSGYVITHMYAGHISYVASYPWLPAILWSLELFLREPSLRRAMPMSLAFAMLVLAGFPQFVLFAWIAVLARVVFGTFQEEGRSRAGLLRSAAALGCVGAGMLLAAPQLLPTMELVAQTQRMDLRSYDFATSFSLPPENLLTFLAPGVLGNSRDVAYWGRWYLWEVFGYVGIAGLLLAALAAGSGHPQRRLWIAVAGAGLLVALGRYTPVYRVLYAWVPGISFFRAPGRYLYLVTFALASLAGMGFDRLAVDGLEARRGAFRMGLAALAIVLVLGAGLAFVVPESRVWKSFLGAVEAAREPELSESLDQGSGFSALRRKNSVHALGWAALAAASLSGILLLKSRGRLGARKASLAMTTVLALELVSFGWRYFAGYDYEGLLWHPQFVRDLQRRAGGPFRMASPGVARIVDVGRCQMGGMDHIAGYEPMLLSRYMDLVNVADGRPARRLAVGISPGARVHAIYQMLGVRFWLVPQRAQAPSVLRRIGVLGDEKDVAVYEDPGALPRAFLVGRAVSIADRDRRLRALELNEFNLRDTVVLEEPVPSLAPAAPGFVNCAAASPGAYAFEVEAPGGGYLVLTETDYPGWEARIDGKPARIYRANHLVQSIVIPPGRHDVRFEFHSRFLLPGFLLAGAAAAVPAIGMFWLRRRAVRKTSAAVAT